jgi:integrase
MFSDVGCRNLKPQAKQFKKSDAGGLYLLVKPSGSKHWHMGYRFRGRQKKLSFGPYPIVTLVAARGKRDAAKRLLADGIDPGVAKLEAKREQAAARTFGTWADEWLEKERTQVDERTMAGKERYVGYLKSEFGHRLMPAIKRGDVLLYLREFEKTGKLETRDRVRGAGEQICIYADVKGDGYNPFSNLRKQLTANVSMPRPALTDPVAVATLFRTIAAPFERARFDDLVGYAVRFTALTVVRPGEIANAEWTEFDGARWTIPAEKMKMKHEHVVPLSLQALALLKQVKALTGGRRFVFSCSRDKPISDNTLNRRLRDLGYDTTKQHCAHGFRTTFSTLSNGETDRQENKMWDGDVIELQLAHLDESSVKAIYNRTGPLSLISARTKLLQHWADRIETMIDGSNVMPMKSKQTN